MTESSGVLAIDRETVVHVPHRREGQTVRVRLVHKPTGLETEAEGSGYMEAKTAALERLSDDVSLYRLSGRRPML